MPDDTEALAQRVERKRAHGDGSVERWLRANRIAVIAMGKWEDEPPGMAGRPRRKGWKACDDPLACVCLTELIIQEMTLPLTSARAASKEPGR